MPGRARDRSSEHGAVLIVTLFWAMVLVWVVGSGWARILADVAPDPVAHWFAGVFLAVGAVLCAYLVGNYFGGWHESDEDSASWHGPLFVFILLLGLSTIGSANALFYAMEGRNVLEESVDSAQGTLTRLASTGRTALLDPEHEERRAAVNRLLTSLREEIVNPHGGNTCGVGPAANQIIAELAQVLPGFRSVSQRAISNACDEGNAEAIYRSYENQARRILSNDPDFVRNGGPQREAFLTQLDEGLRHVQSDLRGSLAGLGGLDLSGGSYEPARRSLEAANAFYIDQRQQLQSLEPEAGDVLPQQLDLDPVRGLGSWSHILPTLASRLDRGSTWFYILTALLFDAVLIALFAWHARLRRPSGAQPQSKRRSDPQFLWVNEVKA